MFDDLPFAPSLWRGRARPLCKNSSGRAAIRSSPNFFAVYEALLSALMELSSRTGGVKKPAICRWFRGTRSEISPSYRGLSDPGQGECAEFVPTRADGSPEFGRRWSWSARAGSPAPCRASRGGAATWPAKVRRPQHSIPASPCSDDSANGQEPAPETAGESVIRTKAKSLKWRERRDSNPRPSA